MPRRLLAALPLLAATACSTIAGSEPDEAALDAGRQRPADLTLALGVSPLEIRPGDTARVEATLRNPLGEAVRIRFSSGCQILIYVEDEAGRVVYPSGGGWGCTAALSELSVPAGGSRSRVDAWTGEEARWEPGTGLRHTALPTGSYRAYARLEGTLEGAPLRLESPTVTVRVR